MNNNYVNRKKTCEQLGVHYHTIYAMAKRNENDTIMVGQQQKYNVNKYINDNNHITMNTRKRREICYCRVSSQKQKEDLRRQIDIMKTKYPNNEIISDIGSGINYKRVGLRQIIDYAIKGEISKVIITYKDRLMRIGYEMIEYIITEYSKGEIIVINKKDEMTAEEEMTKDVISIMNVYVARTNGIRGRRKKQNGKKQDN